MSERWDGNMMTVEKERFGEFIRREREGKEIGLREMAKLIGVSATYLSKVERDEFAPPAEDKVRVIAAIIRCDTDDLLARAGRVSTDITDIIKRRPVELSALLRTANGLSAEDIAGLTRQGEYLSRKDAEIERLRAERDALRGAAREYLQTLGGAMKSGKFEMGGSAEMAHFVRQAMQRLDSLVFDRAGPRPAGLEKLHEPHGRAS